MNHILLSVVSVTDDILDILAWSTSYQCYFENGMAGRIIFF